MPDPSERAIQGLYVEEALSRLTREHQQVLRLCYFHGASVAEAAVTLSAATAVATFTPSATAVATVAL